MSNYRKKLIEVNIPLQAINVESAKDASLTHGHPSTLHRYWARRPLAACRAVVFASMVDDPSECKDEFPFPDFAMKTMKLSSYLPTEHRKLNVLSLTADRS